MKVWRFLKLLSKPTTSFQKPGRGETETESEKVVVASLGGGQNRSSSAKDQLALEKK